MLITQMLVPRFTVVPASLLLTVGVAAVSYRYLERPFLKLQRALPVAHADGSA